MSSEKRNTYLDRGMSDESDNDAGYDSEAAEISKAGRSIKRRKIDHGSTDDESGGEQDQPRKFEIAVAADRDHEDEQQEGLDEDEDGTMSETSRRAIHANNTAVPEGQTERLSHVSRDDQISTKKKNSKAKDIPPGVVYLSSLPPYLKPSALRNLLSQRGFSPITRLFLSPASKHKSNSKKNSRQSYTEGWIEFASKKTARKCAETLNAQLVGGKKGGYYHDDVWNMKYLRGMRWEELMAGVREEKREMEGRRDEERRTIMRDTKRFVEGVEEGRRVQGMKRKKASKNQQQGQTAPQEDVKRTWRQFDVKGENETSHQRKDKAIKSQGHVSDDVKQVLGKIF